MSFMNELKNFTIIEDDIRKIVITAKCINCIHHENKSELAEGKIFCTKYNMISNNYQTCKSGKEIK